MSNEDEERNHGKDDHSEAVDQLASICAEVEGVEPQVDRMLGHDILAGCLVFVGSGGFDQFVSCGKVVGVIDLFVGDVPSLPQDCLLVRLVSRQIRFSSKLGT